MYNGLNTFCGNKMPYITIMYPKSYLSRDSAVCWEGLKSEKRRTMLNRELQVGIIASMLYWQRLHTCSERSVFSSCAVGSCVLSIRWLPTKISLCFARVKATFSRRRSPKIPEPLCRKEPRKKNNKWELFKSNQPTLYCFWPNCVLKHSLPAQKISKSFSQKIKWCNSCHDPGTDRPCWPQGHEEKGQRCLEKQDGGWGTPARCREQSLRCAMRQYHTKRRDSFLVIKPKDYLWLTVFCHLYKLPAHKTN